MLFTEKSFFIIVYSFSIRTKNTAKQIRGKNNVTIGVKIGGRKEADM